MFGLFFRWNQTPNVALNQAKIKASFHWPRVLVVKMGNRDQTRASRPPRDKVGRRTCRRPGASNIPYSSSFFLASILGKAPEIIRGLACLTRGREDGAIVLFQKNYPRADVVGMPEMALDAKVCAEERCGELGD